MAVGFFAAGPGLTAPLPLAITEVMSSASTFESGTNRVIQQADFFEFHNYGNQAIDLTGFLFADYDKVFPGGAARDVFDGIIIQPGETIIMVRADSGTIDTNHFRQIWGETNLPPGLQQIIFYPNEYGFNSNGDCVILADAQSNIVDQVCFGEARVGRTFIGNTNTGEFGIVTEPGMPGVWKAVMADDWGSPGYVSGPIPLRVVEMSPSLEVDAGTPQVCLTIRADGLPRPAYQWRHAGTNLPGAVTATLCLTNLSPQDAGSYDVVLDNGSAYGLEQITSTGLVLTVNPQISCPRVDIPGIAWNPALATNCITIYVGQSARLTGIVRGYENPALQWSFQPLGGVIATNLAEEYYVRGTMGRTLILENAQPEQSGTYFLTASNTCGMATGVVLLIVGEKPKLYITEIMAESCTFGGMIRDIDWWELTNFDLIPLNLKGYTWDDRPNMIGGGPTITNDVIIQPEESVVFVQGKTRQEFLDWWGEGSLPPDLQVISYQANSFGSTGEEVLLWNGAAAENWDTVAQVEWSTVTPGVSLYYLSWVPGSEYGLPSEIGEHGAFQAPNGCDIGSPGYTANLAPVIAAHPTSAVVGWGLEASLRVVAHGFPPCRYQWQFNGTNLPQATNAWLTLAQVQTNLAGDYRVVISNPHGQTTSQVARVEVAPIHISLVFSVDHSTVTLTGRVVQTNLNYTLQSVDRLVGAWRDHANVIILNGGNPATSGAIRANAHLFQFQVPARADFSGFFRLIGEP